MNGKVVETELAIIIVILLVIIMKDNIGFFEMVDDQGKKDNNSKKENKDNKNNKNNSIW